MKAPSSTLVIDAAILVAAALGRSSGAILKASRVGHRLVTTDRVVHEVRRRVALGLKQPELLVVIDGVLVDVTVVPVAELAAFIPNSEIVLRDAVASRNGSTRDAHVLALAWSVEGDIWTTDRDFAGAGVATWSTANLMRAITDAAGGRP